MFWGKLRLLINLEKMAPQNNVKKAREKILMSKSALVKKAKVSRSTSPKSGERGCP